MANMGNTAVTALAQQTTQAYPMLNYGTVYAATWGLGFYRDTTFLTPVGVDPGPAGNIIRNELKISPNPVKDRFCVDLADFSKNTELFLFTADGHQLISQPVTAKKTWIDVSRLPSGLYYIRVIGQRSIGTAKILKSD